MKVVKAAVVAAALALMLSPAAPAHRNSAGRARWRAPPSATGRPPVEDFERPENPELHRASVGTYTVAGVALTGCLPAFTAPLPTTSTLRRVGVTQGHTRKGNR